MPKKKSGGSRKKSKKRNQENSRELLFKDTSQEYGKIIESHGDSRFTVQTIDGKDLLGKVRGKMRKKVYVNIGDIVLVSLRDFQKSKCDIIHKYNAKEVRDLKIYKELPDTIIMGVIRETQNNTVVDDVFDFDTI
jgi:translation initiation factor 1A